MKLEFYHILSQNAADVADIGGIIDGETYVWTSWSPHMGRPRIRFVSKGSSFKY